MIVLTGDIATAEVLPAVLQVLDQHVLAAYFVLGKHDYYSASVSQVRALTAAAVG